MMFIVPDFLPSGLSPVSNVPIMMKRSTVLGINIPMITELGEYSYSYRIT